MRKADKLRTYLYINSSIFAPLALQFWARLFYSYRVRQEINFLANSSSPLNGLKKALNISLVLCKRTLIISTEINFRADYVHNETALLNPG